MEEKILDNDTFKPLDKIAEENGFAFETHTVTTEDGYILTVHRIPGSLNETIQQNPKPIAFLQHGLTGDSSEFMLNAPLKAPAFILSREGYDVWMGNNRGCKFSIAHHTLNLKNAGDKEIFWNFDFEEMGLYDIPAMVDYALNLTGNSKLTLIGHSMGST